MEIYLSLRSQDAGVSCSFILYYYRLFPIIFTPQNDPSHVSGIRAQGAGVIPSPNAKRIAFLQSSIRQE